MSRAAREARNELRFLTGVLCDADDHVVTRCLEEGLLGRLQSWWGLMGVHRALMLEALHLLATLCASGPKGKRALLPPLQGGGGRPLIRGVCDMIKIKRLGPRRGLDASCFVLGLEVLGSMALSAETRSFLWRGSLLRDVAGLWDTAEGETLEDVSQRLAILQLMTNVAATGHQGRKVLLRECLLLSLIHI